MNSTMNSTMSTDGLSSRKSHIAQAIFLLIAALLSFAPAAILAPAIGWPASLGLPAAAQLTAITAKPAAVQQGYALYLLYSILVLPAMVIAARHAGKSLAQPLIITALCFASLSVIARCIGILRWLTVMPALAAAHTQADAAQRSAIELAFTAITRYGGGIGELLGVSLFMALSVALVCIAALIHQTLPRWLSGLGLVAALALFSLSAPVFGITLSVPIALAVSLLSLWFIGMAIWLILLRKP